MSLISIILTTNWMLIIQILIVAYVAKYYYKYFTRQSPLPGPFPLPLIGNLLQVGLNPAKYALDHHEEFGDMLEFWVGSKRFIVISNHSLIDQIYIPNTKTHFFKRLHFPLFDRSGIIFNDDYHIWKRNRKFIAQSLMSPDFLRQVAHRTQLSFNENEKLWDKKECHIDFAKWIKNFMADFSLQTIRRKPSYCLRSYSLGLEQNNPINLQNAKESIKYLHAIQMLSKKVIFQIFIPRLLKEYFPVFYNLSQKYERNTRFLVDNLLGKIEKRRIEIEKMPDDEKVGSDLMDMLLTMNTSRDPHGDFEGEAPLSNQEISNILLDISVAGVDTTGNVFCFTIWLLAHHPKVCTRFQEEIKRILGDDTSRTITHGDLEKFKYLDAIIKESQRILPLFPLIPRTSSQESIIGGKYWETNTSFFVNNEYISKSHECWKEPDQFIPERFLKESGHEIAKNSFMPFGGGVRMCPGRHMAVVQMKTLLILFYRKYDVELVDKTSTKPKFKYIAANSCYEMKVIIRPKIKC